MSESTDRPITLKHNFVLPESVLLWWFQAADRGVILELHNDKLRVQAREPIEADDDLFIRQHRDLLVACTDYIAKIAAEPLV